MFSPSKIQDARSRFEQGAYSESRLLRALPAIFVLMCLAACSHRDPQAAFDHARETLRKGDTGAAALESEKGYKEFHTASSEWAWKFTILRAWMLHARGMNEEALKLLSSEAAPLP